jgi:ZIP family zinc transporter
MEVFMEIVFLSAIGVGFSTILGALIGFILKKPSMKFNNIMLSFASGVMLAASIWGLIIPAIECGKYSFIITVIGIFCGALLIELCNKAVPHLHSVTGLDDGHMSKNEDKINKVLLFVIAIGVHNLPEGLATGVSFGTGNINDAIMVALSIELQNIPEGMAVILPMMSVGISTKKSVLFALFTGAIEIIGTLLGYFVVNIAMFILPFALSFAGGTMLQVVNCEMIAEIYSKENNKLPSYALLLGFSVMLVLDSLL